MKLSTCVSTLAAALLATAVPVINADGVCESNIDLSNMGTVNINKVSGGELEIQVTITGDSNQVTEGMFSTHLTTLTCCTRMRLPSVSFQKC